MNTELPNLTFVRVQTAGGPYQPEQTIALAFTDPRHGVLASLDRKSDPTGVDLRIPDTISVIVLQSAGPYRANQHVTLSFVDPAIARIHAAPHDEDRRFDGHVDARPAGSRSADFMQRDSVRPEPRNPVSAPADQTTSSAIDAQVAAMIATSSTLVEPGRGVGDAAGSTPSEVSSREFVAGESPVRLPILSVVPPASFAAHLAFARAEAPGAQRYLLAEDGDRVEDPVVVGNPNVRGRVPSLKLDWPAQRAARFVQVADKLFTVDRLGWYRHVLAMRMLVAEHIEFDPAAEPESARIAADSSEALRAVRVAALEALGAPLLAAYMPGFAVTADWLETVDGSALAHALAHLRKHAVDPGATTPDDRDMGSDELRGDFDVAAYVRLGASTPEAALPAILVTRCKDASLSAALTRYRSTLIELFDQTAAVSPMVRLRQMAQPNPLLDDRLWQVVGAVQSSLAPDEAT